MPENSSSVTYSEISDTENDNNDVSENEIEVDADEDLVHTQSVISDFQYSEEEVEFQSPKTTVVHSSCNTTYV